MCLRVFVSTRDPIRPTPSYAGEPPPVSFWRLDAEIAAVEAILGGSVVEAGAHTGCACGFELSSGEIGPWNDVERVADIDSIYAMLTDAERTDLAKCRASRASLFEVLRLALANGPVGVYAIWWNDEVRVDERRQTTFAEMEDALEAFPERVVLEIER